MLTTSLGRLRLISFIEGISYLLLIFVGMPLKYGMGIRSVNYFLGMSHGVLTMIFVLLLFIAFADKCISFVNAIKVFAASMVPFGAFGLKTIQGLDRRTRGTYTGIISKQLFFSNVFYKWRSKECSPFY